METLESWQNLPETRCPNAIEDDFMVIPRLCSSARESMYLILPAERAEMIPFAEINESERADLP